MKLLTTLLLVTMVLSSSACIQLGSPARPIHYFVFEALPNNTESYSDKRLTIEIELIEFPEYLLGRQIVTQRRQQNLHFSDSKRWATALDDQLLSLLSANLKILLPEATIAISPWHSNRGVDYKLQLSVNKLSGQLGHQTDVDIHWQVHRTGGHVQRGRYLDQRSINNSYEELITALNQGLEDFSLELAWVVAESGQ